MDEKIQLCNPKAMMLRTILRLIFHALPLLPILTGEPRWTFAALVVVVLSYIKARKFSAELNYYIQRQAQGLEIGERAISDARMMRDRWAWITFLKFSENGSTEQKPLP